MSKVYSIDEIASIVTPIAQRYGVTAVWLFGSYARGEATEASDIDLLIDGGDITSLWGVSAFRLDLEDALQKPVDMITLGIEDRDFLDHIRRDEVRLYEAA
jgi:hypothetical protein